MGKVESLHGTTPAEILQSGIENLDGIEAEALELMEKDPAEAERFFGNILVQGKGAWMPQDLWAKTEQVAK